MKIGGKKNVGTASTVRKPDAQNKGGKPDKADKAGSGGGGDNVVLSPKAREINRIKKMLESIPEVRGDMVVKLKEEIESGSYHRDAGKVAEKMIERALRNVLNTKK